MAHSEFLKTLPVDKARGVRLNPEQALSTLFEGEFKPTYGSSFYETKDKMGISGTLHREGEQYPTEIDITFPSFFSRTVSKLRGREPLANVYIVISDNTL